MTIRVVRAGLLTSVQDQGRHAREHGVVGGGVMDRHAARIANLLAGNDADAALLEVTLGGPKLEFDDDVVAAITGADLAPRVDDVPVATWRTLSIRAGSTLELSTARRGCRAYVAIAGGIDVPSVLGSRSTDMGARIGGVAGRALEAGDVLRVFAPGPLSARRLAQLNGRSVSRTGVGPSLTRYVGRSRVRVLEGPEYDCFSDSGRRDLFASGYAVLPESNRMGYRLDGAVLELAHTFEMVSSPVSAGVVQVPPSGLPIVLMADSQTVGGYPRIAAVISPDLPVLAQLRPGDTLHFEPVGINDAHRIHREQERDMDMLELALGLQ